MNAANGPDALPASISVVIPCHNEGEAVAGVVDGVREQLPRLRGAPEWEVIVVDDGSTDDTPAILDRMEGIRVVHLAENAGYGAALKAGIRSACGEVVVTCDADGQHDPQDLPSLLEGTGAYALTVGSRTDASSVPLLRRPGKKVLSLCMDYLTGRRVPDINSGYRVFRRETILRYLHLCSNRFSFSISSTMALVSEGHPVRFVPITCRPRTTGASRVGAGAGLDALLRLFRVAVVFHPLRIFLPPSLLCIGVGVVSAVRDILSVNITDMTLMLWMAGLMFFFFGLVSEQLAHLRRELR